MVLTVDDDNHHSSLSGEDSNTGGNTVGSGDLKKGPWSPEEDAILTDYIKKHGPGNWNAVRQFSGLSRCGKSCRLRWVNHLRPNLKKDEFTPEEEDTIIRLQAKMGNRWARMAAELPGRTDNEIKNFFNTRRKRLERAGIYMYPDDVSNQNISHDSQKSPVSDTFSNEFPSSYNLLEAGMLGAPVFKIDHSLCPDLYSLKLPGNNILPQDLVPSSGFYYYSPTNRSQRLRRESDASNGLSDTATSSLFTQRNCNAQFQHYQPYELPPLPESYCGDNSSLQDFTGSHALINGTHSTSTPSFGFGKLELPSLQSSDSDCSFWDPRLSPLPSIKCTDTFIQSPKAIPSQSDGAPDTDGLLESIVWPSKKVVTSVFDTDPLENATAGDIDDFLVDFEPESEAFADTTPPIDSSTAAIFNDHTVTGFSFDELSFDELQSTDDIVALQHKTPDADRTMTPAGIESSNQNHNGDSNQLDSWRPDTWLNANMLSPDTPLGKDYSDLQKAISALKGDKHHL